ncbi:hypothetical protein EGT07_21705 [Herbaspirillum sp. HC18]|nr:hypothetical protein EGT07_21705 [Herbaspirillum sp. HC18]
MQTDAATSSRDDLWPALPYEEWKDTLATLHMWLQIVGKIRLVSMPWLNHSWHVALQPTARGLTTSRMPYGERTFQIDFDFIAHELVIATGEGERRTLALRPRTVADFYHELFSTLDALGLQVRINTTPNEVAEAIPFEQDNLHASYDRKYADRFRRALLQADRVFHAFRARFIGKTSPVHFFWGAADLAVTRFSGNLAPPHPAGVPHCPDWVMREAYSHQLSSCGFWPGGEMMPEPVFYAYAYPEPDGFSAATVRPREAYYHGTLREFILPYEAVRQAEAPDAMLLDFLQDCYEAAATLGGWDRSALEWMQPPK